METAAILHAVRAVAPLDPAHLLTAFPSMDFPGRTTLKIGEIAPRLKVSWSHLADILTEDAASLLDLTLTPGAPRSALRITLSSYRRWIAARWLATNATLPPTTRISPADALAQHPELEPDFGTACLTLKEACSLWGCSYQHLANLAEGRTPDTAGRLATAPLGLLDLRSHGSTKATWRIPVEEYRRATTAGLAAGRTYTPTPRDGTPRYDHPGQQHLFPETQAHA